MTKKRYFLRTKSVLSPSAQSNKLCELGDDRCEVVDSVVDAIGKVKDSNPAVIAVIELQARYGLRISEVLNISNTDLGSNGRVTIKGMKGSENRVVHVFQSQGYLARCKKSGVHPFTGYDRFFFYRLYKRLGFIYKSKKSGKYSVTHSFRHKAIESLRNEGVENTDIANFIGHKNSKNTENYGRN